MLRGSRAWSTRDSLFSCGAGLVSCVGGAAGFYGVLVTVEDPATLTTTTARLLAVAGVAASGVAAIGGAILCCLGGVMLARALLERGR